MNTKVDLSFIDKIEELRAIPQLTMDVVTMLNNPSISIRELVERIKLDSAMVAFILRACNQPFFGIRTNIDSIPRAINLLGFANLKSILMSYFLRNIYKISANEYISNYLWEHAVFVAFTARELSNFLDSGGIAEEAYLAGLLHDLGKLVIYMHEPDTYEKLMQEADRERKAFILLEKKKFGYTHLETGLYLMNKWGFADLLKEAVRYHHDFHNYSGREEIVKLVAFANSTVHYSIEENEGMPDDFLKLSGMSEEEYKILLERLSHIIEDVRKIFME